jgi:ribosomal protein S18 acetylase RimI-like enzyme
MPIADDPNRPEGRILRAGDGAPLARFVPAERDGAPVADLFELLPGAEPAVLLPAVLTELAGWCIAGDEALGEALAAAGGRPGRRADVLSRDLRAAPPPAPAPLPAGLRVAPADRPATDLLAAYRAAYPPAHPDQVRDHLGDLRAVLAGEDGLGPLLPASVLAVDAGGRVAGAVLVTDPGGAAPEGGPWVAQLFRDPGRPGTGRALLTHALAAVAAAGLPTLSLAVTRGNPAAELYRALGFERAFSTLSVFV